MPRIHAENSFHPIVGTACVRPGQERALIHMEMTVKNLDASELLRGYLQPLVMDRLDPEA